MLFSILAFIFLQTAPVLGNFCAEIALGGIAVTVEIADTPKTRAQGLMGRESLPPNHGMLFIYPQPQILSFWMKDTLIPLSVAFFDANQQLINIEEMAPPSQTSIPCCESAVPALYALEMPRDWFRKNEIFPGTKFAFLE